jgi:DNA helicase II / ATP-dependent DNA helicase PcrA
VRKDAAMRADLLDELNPKQKSAAQTSDGRVAILAVAGAGKTKTISHRIAYAVGTGRQNPATGLALSYTTKSAAELRLRIAQLGVPEFATSTIHGAAWRQLKHFWPQVLGGNPWNLVTNRSRVFDVAFDRASAKMDAAERRTIQVEIERLKALGLDAESYGNLVSDANKQLAEVWSHYTDYCHSSRLIDFDDMLQLTIGMLQSRPDVLQEVQRRYSWFTIDEYQDITPLQNQLLNLWVGERDQVCVVGDPTQSIYEFAGADPNFLREFAKAPETQLFRLDNTYRLTEEVGKVANPIAGWLGEQQLLTSKTGGSVSVQKYSNPSDEIHQIVNHIQRLHLASHKYSDIAVLLRTGQAVDDYSRAFENAGIPVNTRQGGRFIDSKLVQQALLTLKAVGGSSEISVLQSVTAVATGLGWSPNWVESGLSSADWTGLSALVEIAELGADTVEEFLDSVGDQILALAEPRANAVSVMTVHQSKGLEWEIVFLPRTNDSNNLSEESAISEARVLFVAITRAQTQLHVSYPDTSEYGQKQNLNRFISADLPEPLLPSQVIEAQVNELFRKREPLKVFADKCETCGLGISAPVEIMTTLCKKCQPPLDNQVLSNVKDFRQKAADSRDIPAWLLISESAVQSMSIRPPKTKEELKRFAGVNRLTEAEFAELSEIFRLRP